MSLSTTASVLTTPLAHLLVSSLHTVCCSVVTVGCVECCIIVRWLRMVMSEVVDTNDDLYYWLYCAVLLAVLLTVLCCTIDCTMLYCWLGWYSVSCRSYNQCTSRPQSRQPRRQHRDCCVRHVRRYSHRLRCKCLLTYQHGMPWWSDFQRVVVRVRGQWPAARGSISMLIDIKKWILVC